MTIRLTILPSVRRVTPDKGTCSVGWSVISVHRPWRSQSPTGPAGCKTTGIHNWNKTISQMMNGNSFVNTTYYKTDIYIYMYIVHSIKKYLSILFPHNNKYRYIAKKLNGFGDKFLIFDFMVNILISTPSIFIVITPKDSPELLSINTK